MKEPEDLALQDGKVYWRGIWYPRPKVFIFDGGSLECFYDERGVSVVVRFRDDLKVDFLKTAWSPDERARCEIGRAHV